MKRFIVVLLFLFLAGCVTDDIATMKADINQLKRESFDIKKETSESKSAISAEIAALKEKSPKEDSLNAIREGMVALRTEVSGISKDLQSLMGRFDENKYFIDKALKDKSSEMDLLRSQIAALETQLKEMQQKLSPKTDADAAPKEKAEGKKETKPETEETKVAESKTPEAKDPAKFYGAALASFKDKKYKEAREKFEAFLKAFPKDKLAGNAQFWIGEAYYAEEDYAGAIVEYDAFLKNYPKSDKARAALLKQGYSFVEMNDKKAAKGILEQVREKYPKSKEAALAKKKLEEIAKKGKK